MMISKPGIYFDIDPIAYHLDCCVEPSISQTLIKILLDQSPAHARYAHPRLTPRTPPEPEAYSHARAIGDAVHTLLLGRGKTLAIGQFADWRTERARSFKGEALLAGQTPILEYDAGIAHQIVNAAMRQLVARELAGAVRGEGGQSEVVLVWRECSRETGSFRDGFWARTMIDRLTDAGRHIIDIKTTERSGAPHSVGPMVADWCIQAAMHERGLNALDPENAGKRRHTFIVIEQYEPFALAHYDLMELHLDFGRRMLDVGLRIWGECMRTNEWPSYPMDVQYPELPAWHAHRLVAHEMEREEARQRQAPPNDLMMAG